jgi:hypothetical protein
MFDGSIVLLVPVLMLLLFLGLPALPTVLFYFLLGYYVVIAFVLRMSLMTSLQYIKWNILPKKRPARRPLYIRQAYDIMGIASWRLHTPTNRSDADGPRQQ